MGAIRGLLSLDHPRVGRGLLFGGPRGCLPPARRSACLHGHAGGDATPLRVGDVDFERGVIRVSRPLSPGKHGELVVQSPKSHKSREVPLIAALRPYAEQAAIGKLPDELLFAGPGGGRLTNHNVRRAIGWDALRAAIGRRDLRMHDLRHTFATLLFDAGASAPDIRATLGNSSLQVTVRAETTRSGGSGH